MKHIHFIGICGVGMGSLAILWQKKGWRVTGSDAGFFPPISTHLKKHQINFYPGWHPEKMGRPDLVVVGNVAGSENPEWQYVQQEKLPFVSYPELIAKYLVKENSIVCTGTYGKTTSTALLAWIFKKNNINPAYMFGGVALDLEESADDPPNSTWSILEGDEYKTARWDNSPKFFHYKPSHLLLTAIKWDHADIYPTAESYLEVFKELILSLPKNGLLVSCADDKQAKKITELANCKIVKYGKADDADYIYKNVKQTKNGLSFTITRGDKDYEIQTTGYGEYLAENICGCFALSLEMGLPPEKIISAINDFKGNKRRLENRGKTKTGAMVFDDIAHSPDKAKSVLETLRKIFNKKIYAVFEPNTGSRQENSISAYDQAFASADEVIIPQLTKLKTLSDKKHLNGHDLSLIIGKTHPAVKYLENDEELVKYLKQKTQPDEVVVFLGSHSFRGMIEKIID